MQNQKDSRIEILTRCSAMTHDDALTVPHRASRSVEETHLHLVAMSGMGDGYVGTAEDSARIRRMDKKR